MRSTISWAVTCSAVASALSGTSGGIMRRDRPVFNWKPENPVDAFTVFMIANRMHGSLVDHPFWLLSTWYRMAWLTVLFVRSLLPSVSGGYDIDLLSFTPVSLWSAVQISAVKSGSRLEMRFSIRPFSQY